MRNVRPGAKQEHSPKKTCERKKSTLPRNLSHAPGVLRTKGVSFPQPLSAQAPALPLWTRPARLANMEMPTDRDAAGKLSHHASSSIVLRHPGTPLHEKGSPQLRRTSQGDKTMTENSNQRIDSRTQEIEDSRLDQAVGGANGPVETVAVEP